MAENSESSTYVVERRKEPQVLLLDFGTLFVKGSTVTNKNEFNDDLVTIRNQIYYISQEKAKRLETESKSEVSIPTGYFTRKEIEEKQLLFQADPMYVQLDAIPKNVEILTKAYQNVCENLETSLKINSITNHYHDWAVIVAIAAFETREAQKEVENLHLDATKKLGFRAIYINFQIMFDYVSQIHYQKSLGLQEGYGLIINIGGGDSEVAAISGVPILHTFRRFPLAGQDVTLYCQEILREQLTISGILINTIEEWLIEGGTVNNDAPSTIKEFKRKKIDIKPLLDAAAILFDYKRYYGKERRFNSITEIIIESIDSLQHSSAFDQEIALILQSIIVVGGGAHFKGLTNRLELEIKAYYPEFLDEIQVFVGDNPQMSGINGIRQLVQKKYENSGLNYTILNSN